MCIASKVALGGDAVEGGRARRSVAVHTVVVSLVELAS